MNVEYIIFGTLIVLVLGVIAYLYWYDLFKRYDRKFSDDD